MEVIIIISYINSDPSTGVLTRGEISVDPVHLIKTRVQSEGSVLNYEYSEMSYMTDEFPEWSVSVNSPEFTGIDSTMVDLERITNYDIAHEGGLGSFYVPLGNYVRTINNRPYYVLTVSSGTPIWQYDVWGHNYDDVFLSMEDIQLGGD